MISEKVPWGDKWLHETGGRRRCADSIKSTAQKTNGQPDPVKLNTSKLSLLLEDKKRAAFTHRKGAKFQPKLK